MFEVAFSDDLGGVTRDRKRMKFETMAQARDEATRRNARIERQGLEEYGAWFACDLESERVPR